MSPFSTCVLEFAHTPCVRACVCVWGGGARACMGVHVRARVLTRVRACGSLRMDGVSLSAHCGCTRVRVCMSE